MGIFDYLNNKFNYNKSRSDALKAEAASKNNEAVLEINLNTTRSAFLGKFDEVTACIEHIPVSEEVKQEARIFYDKANKAFTDKTTQELIDGKAEVRALAGAVVAKTGLIQLRHNLREKGHPEEAIQALIAGLTKVHTDLYVSFTPFEKAIHALDKHQKANLEPLPAVTQRKNPLFSEADSDTASDIDSDENENENENENEDDRSLRP